MKFVMESAGQVSAGVIHFSCLHCHVSLTVDDSLAGITGPCPACGESITAPRLKAPSRVEVKPRELVRRDGEGGQGSDRSRQVSGEQSRVNPESARRESGVRAIRPESGGSESRRERAEVAAVAKMLVVGLIVLAIVLALAFWLNVRLG
ncbi:hypothetical protein V2O64_19715 [Verrucomicrobiaceae bacterium 227]